MIVATRNGGNREARGLNGYRADFTGTDRIPRPGESMISHSGRRVGLAEAVGLPAVLRAIRLVTETIGLMPMRVLRELGGELREPAPDSAQWRMLHHKPNLQSPAFSVWSFAVACLIRGGVVFQYLRANDGEVLGISPLPPDSYGGKPVWQDGQLVAKVRTKDGTKVLVHGRDMLYIPGILLDDPVIGVSVIEAQRHALGNPIARQEFEGRYLANDTTVGLVLKHEGDVEEPQRKAIRESFEDRHKGQPGRPALMWGGWELDKIGVSLEEAQFVESQRFTVQDAARMLGVPSGKLGDPDAPSQADPQQEDRDLLRYGLMPWMARLEQGIHADDLIFPDKTLVPAFHATTLMRADDVRRNEGHLKARQAGWLTANEIRRREGMPDHPDGDVLQIVPVGGGANPETKPAA